jgi:hypothetical protein
MSVLVEQQDETINVIETTAAAVEKDTEAGYVYFHSSRTCADNYLPVSDTLRRPSHLLALHARSDGFASSSSWSSSLLWPLLWPLSSPTTPKNNLDTLYSWQRGSPALRAATKSPTAGRRTILQLLIPSHFSCYSSLFLLSLDLKFLHSVLFLVTRLHTRFRHFICTARPVHIYAYLSMTS